MNDHFLGLSSAAWAAIGTFASVAVTIVLVWITRRYVIATFKILAATERQAAATEASLRLLTRDVYVKQIPLRIFIDQAITEIDRFLSISIAESRLDGVSRSCHPPQERAAALAAAEQISAPAAALARATITRHERAANPGGVTHRFDLVRRDGGDIDAAEAALRAEYRAIKADYEQLRSFLSVS